MKFRDAPDPVKFKKQWSIKTGGITAVLIWASIIFLTIFAVKLFAEEEETWPESIKKYSCDKAAMWKICGGIIYLTIDCDGNVWWLRTPNDSPTASVIEEKIVYRGVGKGQSQKIVEETIKNNDIKSSKSWMEWK